MTPNVLDHEPLFNSIRLGGVVSPGVVKLTGHDRKVEWDTKKGPGLSGATTTPKSIPPIEFQAEFYLVRDDAQGIDQIAEWPAFQRVIESTLKGGKAKALDIYHPYLAEQDPPISSVCKGTVGGRIDDGKGGQRITVKFQEYRPPKPAPKTPTGSKANGFVGPTQDPDAKAKAELARLTEQYKATPWG